ncbi:MAG: hypothetical protein IJG68_07360 [Bacilli bacterium]|nr:hypothetical protein [Bacilli bacterium]
MSFTGINSEEANFQINLFLESMSSIAGGMERAGANFFNRLKSNWYSPSAVQFSSTYSTSLYQNTVEVIRSNAYMIANAARDAANSMILANGGVPISKEYSYTSSNHDFGALSETGPNGVGMNVGEISAAVNDYSSEVTKCVLSLEKIPMNLSIFDDKDAIVTSFQDTIKSLIETIRSSSSDAIKSINGYIQTEGHKLQTATKQSIQNFQGMGRK